MSETEEWDRHSCPNCRGTGKVRSEPLLHHEGRAVWWQQVCDRCDIEWKSSRAIDARPYYV